METTMDNNNSNHYITFMCDGQNQIMSGLTYVPQENLNKIICADLIGILFNEWLSIKGNKDKHPQKHSVTLFYNNKPIAIMNLCTNNIKML